MSEQQSYFTTMSQGHLVVDGPESVCLRLDSFGRLCSLRHEDKQYRRTLDGDIYALSQGVPCLCDEDQVAMVLLELGGIIARAQDSLAHGKTPVSAQVGEMESVLNRALAWQFADYQREKYAFEEVYGSVFMQPPPNRMDNLVVQAARGCPNKDCTFCAFYDDMSMEPFSFKRFGEHLDALVQFYGPTHSARKGLFLASSALLDLSQRCVLKAFSMMFDRLGKRPDGICAFLDPDQAPRRDRSDYKILAQHGLQQLIICLESGNENVRHLIGRNQEPEKVAREISLIKEAGIHVGITLWIGVDGAVSQADHVLDTRKFLQQIALDEDDFVYLTPLNRFYEDAPLQHRFQDYASAITDVCKAQICPYEKSLEHLYS